MIAIIPAIDLIGGRCVRLTRGDFTAQKEYSSDPVGVARSFEAAGLTRLHLVDLDGARAGSPRSLGVLEQIAAATKLCIDFSGGLRSDADVAAAFAAGAAQVALGSVAAKEPERFCEWLDRFGAERIILAADVRDGRVAIAGWSATIAEQIGDFLQRFAARGVRRVLCTDISRDGVLAGPAFDLYTDLMARFPSLGLIASGGVASIADIARLERLGLSGVIIGKALYEGRIALKDLERFRC